VIWEEKIVEKAYRTFEGYNLRKPLDFAADVGVSDEENNRLRDILENVPLRRIPMEAIHAYYDYVNAAHYDGQFSADDFRYFLPRALELLIEEFVHMRPSLEADWLLSCIRRAISRSSAKTRWPQKEIGMWNRVHSSCRRMSSMMWRIPDN